MSADKRHSTRRLVIATLAFPLYLAANVPQSASPSAPGRADAELRNIQAAEIYEEGTRFVSGDGPQDYSKAAPFYLKAAKAGYAPAQYDLGVMYEQGLGVDCDLEQAARWYRRAAEQGHVEAENDLGTLYATGKGVPHNDAEAARWYARAAEQKDPEATSNLGIMYLRGRGVPQDNVRALQLFRQAADQGYASAQNNLALMYANGQGAEKDYLRAWAWLDIAADKLKGAGSLRDRVAKEMTADEIGRACDLAAEIRAAIAQNRGKEQ